MAVKQITEFKASDGRKFDTEKEAKRHDDLILARREYQEALRKLNRCIAETARTADGHLFELGMWSTYYYVSAGFFSRPALSEVPYLGWNWDLNERDDSVEIITHEGSEHRRREFKIGELYREKPKAIAALLQAQKDWLAERQQEIEASAAKFAQGEDPTR